MMLPRDLVRVVLFLCVALLVPFASACGATGPSVWVAELPASASDNPADVVIHDGDTVSVHVYNQDPLSTKDKVRSDGKISVPAIGEVVARGKRPAVLAKEIEDKLKTILQVPSVTVSLEPVAQINVSVVGEVKNAGIFQLEPTANVLTALSAAGGLTDYADNEKIFVVRKGLPQRVRFRFNDLRAGETHAIGFALRPGDAVVVE